MKKIFLSILLVCSVFLIVSSTAQAMRLPLDASIGYGGTYGGAGGRLTFAELLFVGGGAFDGENMYAVGVQLPLFFSKKKKYKSTPYIAASYGGVAVLEEYYLGETSKKVINGYSGYIGYVFGWDFGMFIHADIGYYYAEYTAFEDTPLEENDTTSDITLNVGIGFRFF